MVVPEMIRCGAPAYLIILVVMLGFHAELPQQMNLQYVELFSGMGCVSLGMMAHGLQGSSHDIALSSYMDLTTTSGFLYLGRDTSTPQVISAHIYMCVLVFAKNTCTQKEMKFPMILVELFGIYEVYLYIYIYIWRQVGVE